tara:strand:+ start:15129 stop:16205 length:1077 start_codon:yes stop_codon:yes gene_type:complete
MDHSIIFRREGSYGGFPVLVPLADGRLSVGLPVAPFHDHYGIGDWVVLVSADEGVTWTETDDPGVPHTWPGSSPRERYDRLATVLHDGTFLCVGTVGWEVWKADRKSEAEALGYAARPHPADNTRIVVGGSRLFVQRSTDGGETWSRREWSVPGIKHLTSFPRHAILEDGTLLVTVYGITPESKRHNWVLRSTDQGETWRFISMGAPESADGSESTLLEVSPGRVLCHTRNEDGELLERWSDDGGLTWTYPVLTTLLGFPPHLLKLADGRILCSYGYRREPMGIRVVVSEDDGQTWSDPIILREDGGTPCSLRENPPSGTADIGYPISSQLPNGDIFTAYYITLEDGVTHSAATRWKV